MSRQAKPYWQPHPWHVLTEAAIAYANAETATELRLAEYRLRSAARRWRDGPRVRGRPAEPRAVSGEGVG
jgi:hypothetical protein